MLDVSFFWRAQFSWDHAEGKRLVPIDLLMRLMATIVTTFTDTLAFQKASAQTDKNRFLASYSFVQDMKFALGPLLGIR